MTRKTNKEAIDPLLEIFINEYVEILQDYEVTTQVAMTEDGVAQPMRMPMTVTGYVMDSDGEFLYLSSNGEEVNQALPISSIKHIGIVQPNDPMQNALDEVETPEGNTYN
jgi:hypothetical protein